MKYLDTKIKYTQHPLATIQRKQTADERRRLTESIERSGKIEDAVLIIKAKSGPGWQILDGWNRYEISKLLRLPCPCEEYKGDKSQEAILDRIETRTTHRDYTPSDRAWLANEYAKMRQALRGEPEESDENVNPARSSGIETKMDTRDSDLVKESAAKHGVSTATLKNLRRVEAASPKLYADVGAKKLTVDAAVKKVRAEAEKKERSTKPVDAAGHEIPDHLADTFNSTELTSLAGEIRGLKKRVHEIRKAGFGAYIGEQTEVDLENAAKAMSFAQPHALCPYCRPTGSKGCKNCRKSGWMTKDAYSNVPKEDRA